MPAFDYRNPELGWQKFIVQFVKYGLVGGVNFVFGIVVFYTLLKIMGLDYVIAFTITWLLGIILTYIINFVWVFKPSDKLEFRERFPKYFAVYLASYFINMGLLWIAVERYGFDAFYAQFAFIPIVVLINFFGFKYWSLK